MTKTLQTPVIPPPFARTRELDDEHRMTGRTTQMLVNAVERAIQTHEVSYVIVRTEAYADVCKRQAETIAFTRDIRNLVKFVSLGSERTIPAKPCQIFRDHAAY